MATAVLSRSSSIEFENVLAPAELDLSLISEQFLESLARSASCDEEQLSLAQDPPKPAFDESIWVSNAFRYIRHGDLRALKGLPGNVASIIGDEDVTPLHLAVSVNHLNCLDFIEFLFNAGADPNAVNSEGKTALHFALEALSPSCNTLPVIALLLNNPKTMINVIDTNGRNPLSIARAKRSQDALRLLFRLPAGAKLPVCQSCLEEMAVFAPRSCDHLYCCNCAEGWLKTMINDGHSFATLRCPSCPQTFSVDEVKMIVRDKAVIEKCDVKSFELCVSGMKDFVWCPRCPFGGLTVEGCTFVTCERCRFHFCTQCRNLEHDGLSCEEFAATYMVEVGEWKVKNSKHCPACHVDIEKNGGCNSMVCSNCSTNFCWKCLLIARSTLCERTHTQRRFPCS